jgi:hypothetical protein
MGEDPLELGHAFVDERQVAGGDRELVMELEAARVSLDGLAQQWRRRRPVLSVERLASERRRVLLLRPGCARR